MDFGLWHGFIGALSLTNLAFCFIGCVVGTLVGVLPGLGPAATTAMLLPLTLSLPPAAAIIMLSGIFYGAMYGGSTTSILVNVPGEAASVVTCFDGFQMTKKGRAGEALAIAAIGSFMAGTFGVIGLSVVAKPLALLALRFGPPEYFGIVLFSLTALLSLSGKSLSKGVTAGALGMFLAAIGVDPLSGSQRLTFGFADLTGGLDIIAVVMGLFGVAEVFANAGEGVGQLYEGSLGAFLPRGKELTKGLLASFRGTVSGFVLGLLPGMAPPIVSFLSYDLEKRISKTPEKFGTGLIEGVAAPEAANNAAAQAGFIPLMALGIPTTPVLAIILAALTIYGLRPGPTLLLQNAPFVWTVIASMYIGNVILLILNLPLVGLWSRLSLVPFRIMGPVILGICFVGAYTVRNSMFDVGTCAVFGIVGYLLKRISWPVAPFILGFILGPMFEQSIRQTLSMSRGSLLILVDRPLALAFIVLAVILPAASLLLSRRTGELEEEHH